MGILVKQGTLPDGFQVSNVYMCFREEVIYITRGKKPKYIIDSYYKIYPNNDLKSSYDIRVPIQVHTNDISQGIYTYLYNEMNKFYPNSINML